MNIGMKDDIVVDTGSPCFHHKILLLVPKENNDHFHMIHPMRINSSLHYHRNQLRINKRFVDVDFDLKIVFGMFQAQYYHR
jgi:hypothetical protein